MPYEKNKRQAFEAAQQAYVHMEESYSQIDPGSPDYGHQTRLAEEELNKAFQIISKAYTTASEHQRQQLDLYSQTLERLKQDLM
ncbi:hypothetical protein [Salipaludibacillus aurantiacus]|uniref:Uncharacterized protein n=1 Tax=Salipaludibacillus aurantiacus TaxID=1601833 RepID=A0A1H9WD13_9BACI|nr:hypothetical protein [Salipaludibacillus aurantiacus]SES31689.1 hypothetical protein SAMN05518684_11629 [Salipaludibacillus aurantiacus]